MKARMLLLLLVLAVAAAVATLKPSRRPWDLDLCTACARVLASGGDPYARDQVIQGSDFPCLYPPLAFDLFRPFAALPDAVPLWNGLKILGFAALLLVWRRFLGPGPDLARLAFAALAFGSPFFAELRSGNAGSLEQLALWSAFTAYVAGRLRLFALIVALTAQIKLQPAVFLGLLLLDKKPRWKEFAAGAAGALLLFSLNEVLHPGLLKGFWAHLADPFAAWRFERGPNNCAVNAFVEHILETLWKHRPHAALWAGRLSAAVALVVAAFTWHGARAIHAGDGTPEEHRRRVVLLGAAAFALIAPRFKDYAFFLLIPPALAALESSAPLLWKVPLAAFAALNSTQAAAEKMGLGEWTFVAGYFKLYAAVLIWTMLLRDARARARSARE